VKMKTIWDKVEDQSIKKLVITINGEVVHRFPKEEEE